MQILVVVECFGGNASNQGSARVNGVYFWKDLIFSSPMFYAC